MTTVGELIKAFEYVKREWGNDSKVVIQIRDESDYLINGAYVNKFAINHDGTVILVGKGHKDAD